MKNYYFKELVKVFSSISSPKEMENFLYGIFTPQELEEIQVRLQIVKLLKKGIPQHDIAQRLKIGVATVTRGSKEIAKGRFATITEKGWQPSKKGG